MEICSDNTRAGAWLQAINLLRSHADGRIYNLIVEVRSPQAASPQSRAIEKVVDDFLKVQGRQPIHTVSETIFPAAEYRLHGISGVYDYAKTIYPEIKRLPENSHGTYAYRLVERRCSDGTTIVPLEILIRKLRKQLERSGPMRAVYELDMGLEPLELKFYEAGEDYPNIRGGQCLSHISLKLGSERQLYLTALYRYQYFLQKALGNFKGLARLQACIAREVGIPVGPIVCHATLAALETADFKAGALTTLIDQCNALASSDTLDDAA